MNAIPTLKDPMSETFIKILRLFLTPDLTSSKAPFTFSYPKLNESSVNQVKTMLDDGVSISGCCRFLSNVFNFDPAVVNAIKNHQISQEEAQIGKISSVLAWIGSDKYCTSDFFYLIVCTLLSDNFDNISQFCLKAMIDHYFHNTPKCLSEEAVNVIIQFFSVNNIGIGFTLSIFNDLLNISIKVKDDKITNNIIRAILVLIQKNTNLLSNFDFKDILNTSNKLFQKLNIDALSLLGEIANTSSSKEKFDNIFADLAKIVTSTFSENGTMISVEKLTPTSYFFSDFIIDYQLNFDSFKNFPQVTDVLPSSSFDSNLSISKILNKNQLEVLKTFQAIFHQFHQNLESSILSFFSSYVEYLSENNKKNQCIETLFFYLYLIENIPKFKVPESFCNVVINSRIFAPEFTLFYSDKDDFQVLNQLRNLGMSLIYRSYPSLIITLNLNASKFPFLFVENYSRLRTFVSIKDMSQFLDNSTIYRLTLVLKKLVEKMSENDVNQEERKRVFSAWSTLFVCINDFLNEPKSMVSLFQSFDFTNNYIRHFFNPTLRPLIFSTLQRYMSMNNDASLSTIAQFCLYIFSYSIYNHDEKFHQLMTELLACLEDAIIHNQKIVKELSVITPALLSFFLHFPTEELLKNTLNFLLLVSFNVTNFSFSHDDMLALGNTIRTMEKDVLSDKNFSIMLSLLAGTKISNMSQDFTIKNPSFILLIMYASADDISQTIQFFYRLCQYSIYNCVQCQKGKLDLLLIEIIKNYPNPFKFFDYTFKSSFSHDELLTVVIQFLSLIFTYQCSPQSVERFIELIVPIPITKTEEEEQNIELETNNKNLMFDKTDIFGKFLECDVKFPPFSDEIMNQLINNFSNTRKIHYVFTPSATPIVINSIPLSEISEGFSFSCYLMVDSAISQNLSQKQIIFRLYDALGNSFLLYSSRSALLCEINSVSMEKAASVSLTTDFPSCQWSMITVIIRKIPEKENKIHLIFSMNKDSKPPFTITDINYSSQYLTAQIGGFIDENTETNDVYCFLGSYHLFNKHLNQSQIDSLYAFGPKGIDPKNNSVKDLLIDSSNNESKNNIYSYIKPFLHVFSEFNLVKLLIPFFGFSTSAPHFFLEKIVDSFRYVSLDQYENYITIISQFLMKAQPNVICYSLYLHFFMLFSETQSSILFKKILFNFNIWFNADDPQTVKRTVQHWTNVLFPDFSQVFIENISIPEIIALIRIHCWFTDEDSNNIINHKRCKNIDIHFIRNCLNRLLTEYASYNLSMDDVRSILSNTFTTHDIQHKMSFLELLDSISSFITDKNEVANELHFLFTTSRPDLFVATLKLILKLNNKPQNSIQRLKSENSSINDSSSNLRLTAVSSYKSSLNTGSLKYPVSRTRTAPLANSGHQSSFYNSSSLTSTSSNWGSNFTNNNWTDNHIECILSNINKQHFTVSFLDAVLESSAEYPEILPIACMIACNLTEKEQFKTIEKFSSLLNTTSISKEGEGKSLNNEFYSRFQAQKRLEKLKTWFIWPVILIFKAKNSKEHQSMMLKTIISITKANFSVVDQILAFLDLIYINYGIKITTIQLEMLDIICSKITKNSKNETRKMMYRFVRNLLFHYDRNIHSNKLMDEFYNSPFNDNKNKREENSNDKQFTINSMKDVHNLFSDQSLKNELIFRVDFDDDNIDIFNRIINKLDKFDFVLNTEEEGNLNCYIRFIKYLKNKNTLLESDQGKILQSFAHEGWRNFQAMNISFKMYMNTFCSDFDKFFIKLGNTAENLLMNLNEESIKLSLTSIDVLNDRKINQYYQDTNFFNKFESLEMNDFSIWKSFNSTNCLTKKEERKSFHLLPNFSSPFTKRIYKMFQFEIDPFIENSKPLLRVNVLYVNFINSQPCTFAVLPKKILIATKFKKIDIQISDLSYILYRSVNCFEFVKKKGKSYFINFLKTPIEDIIKAIKQVFNQNFYNIPKPVFQSSSYSKFIHTQNIMNDWVNRKITTYEYLLKLNFFGGRSYKMLSKYPVFPLIRDFNDAKVGYKVSPQVWLKMFPSFSKHFNPESSTKTIDLSSKSSQLSISNSNTNIELIPSMSDEEKVQFDENSTNSDNTTQNQEEDKNELKSSIRRQSDVLTSSLISKQFSKQESPIDSSNEDQLTDHPFLSTYQSKKYELTPEFYSMPSCFKQLKLPNDFSSEFEFVYENRKKLESDEVSSTLNVWIDKLFGPTGFIEPLFKSPHPVRNQRPNKQSKNSNQNYQLFLTISSENLIFGSILNQNGSNDRVTVKTIDVEGHCCEHYVDITAKTAESTTLMQLIFSPTALFSASGEEILAVDTETGVFSVIKGTQIVKTQLDSTIDFCEKESVYSSNGGFVFAVQNDPNNLHFLGEAKISPELIVTITSSISFDMTAVSVLSGKIILFERITGRYLRTIETGGIPAKRLLITNGFGFIVAEFPDKIVLYSLSGERIKEMKIFYEIFYLDSFMSEDGFDFLFVSDKTGQIMIIEAFTFKIVEKSSHNINTKIIDINYLPSLGSLLILTQDGKLFSFI